MPPSLPRRDEMNTLQIDSSGFSAVIMTKEGGGEAKRTQVYNRPLYTFALFEIDFQTARAQSVLAANWKIEGLRGAGKKRNYKIANTRQAT